MLCALRARTHARQDSPLSRGSSVPL
jgi:hypothetical protein